MSDNHDPHTGLHSEQGATAGRAPRAVGEPGHQGARPRLAGVREAGPGPGRGVRARLRVQHRAAHPGRAAPAGHRRGRAVRADPPGPRSRFVGPAFRAAEQADVLRLADATGATATPAAGDAGRGDRRSGRPERPCRCAWSSGTHELAALPGQEPLVFNFGHDDCRGPTRPSARRGCRPRCSGSGTSCCRPRSTSRR